MSVLIKGMKIPESCGECKMHFLSSDSHVCCQITDRIPKIVDRFYDSKIDLDARKKSIMSVKRPEWCPLVEVPVQLTEVLDKNSAKVNSGNDELISRPAAIDAVAESLKGVFVESKDIAEKMIGKLPSAQPEIIRCKDCKHYNAGYECLIEGYGIERDKDWFCADAERKENG